MVDLVSFALPDEGSAFLREGVDFADQRELGGHEAPVESRRLMSLAGVRLTLLGLDDLEGPGAVTEEHPAWRVELWRCGQWACGEGREGGGCGRWW